MRNTLAAALLTLGLSAAPALAQSVTIIVDHQPLEARALMDGGRVMVPLRGIFERLGAQVQYTPATRQILAMRGPHQVQLTLGSREAAIDGQPAHLDVPADTLDGRTMVPLRFVSEAMGAEVHWTAATHTVDISSAATPPPPPAAPPKVVSVTDSVAGPLAAGEEVHVRLVGDPGGVATFDLAGVSDHLPMSELEPGRYEGHYTVPRHLAGLRTGVIGRLTLAGLETVKQGVEDPALVRVAAPSIRVSPAQGAVEQVRRPAIEGVFSAPARPDTMRMLVDGVEVTAESRREPELLRWVPPHDLNPGNHRVHLEAVDQQGRIFEQDWSFSISGEAAGTPSLVLRVDSPTPGELVPTIFETRGDAPSGSLMRVTVRIRRSPEPPQILQTQATAGHFSVRTDISMAPSGIPVEIRVEGTTEDGRNLQPVDLTVIRR